MANDQEIYEKHEVVYHYTTASGLKGILKHQTLWATHFQFLNDFKEIEQMRLPLIDAITPVAKEVILNKFRNSLKAKRKIRELGGVNKTAILESKNIINTFYQTAFVGEENDPPIFEPYITSFCSHGDDDKYIQENGLLSQWRSYGDSAGYAVVFDTEKLCDLIGEELSRYQYTLGTFSDVVYDDGSRTFYDEFNNLIGIFEELISRFLQGEDPMMGEAIEPFINAVTRFKHQGFKEEREVRIVTSPMTKELSNFFELETGKESRPFKRTKIKKVKFRNVGSVKKPYIELFNFSRQEPLTY